MTGDEILCTTPSKLFTDDDKTALSRQMRRRLILMLIPCLVLLGVAIYGMVIRDEMLTNVFGILCGAVAIFVYDLFLRPLLCYRKHLNNVTSQRRRTVELPFCAISSNIDLVDGVNYRALTCMDVDGKGRPYERLFYYDAQKPLPDFQEGEMVRVTHHELEVSDIERV